MNILVTGCNGFLAKEVIDFFSNFPNYNLIKTNRQSLDLNDKAKVDSFFAENKVDFVIHTAVCGGKRGQKDTIEDFYSNIRMFDNLYKNSNKFKMMINFGSGAEFDKRTSIRDVPEDLVFDKLPHDYYGLAKNLISRRIRQSSNVVNLRIFGCFGVHELPTRLITNTINRLINGEKPVANGDVYFDFMYAPDVCRVVKFFIDNHEETQIKDLNLCYENKKTIKEIIFLIKNLTNIELDVILNENDKHYTGSGLQLADLKIPLVGLEQGIAEILRFYEIKQFGHHK